MKSLAFPFTFLTTRKQNGYGFLLSTKDKVEDKKRVQKCCLYLFSSATANRILSNIPFGPITVISIQARGNHYLPSIK